ncbi:MAG: 6-bladed beta-propeller [Rikenellaceae bacterium]
MNKFVFLIAVTVICACKGQSKNPNSIDIDLNSVKEPQTEIVEIIKLETRNDALLGDFVTIKENDNYIISSDMKKFVIFDKKGSIHNVFSPIGKATNEVMFIMTYFVTNDYIEVLDVYRKRCVRYGFDGSFLGALELPEKIAEYVRFNNLTIADMAGQSEEHRLSIFDSNNNKVNSGISYKAKGINYGSNKFCVSSNCVYYLPPFYNTIYKIGSEGDLSESLSINFGRHWATDDELEANANHSNILGLWEYLKSNDKIGFLSFIKNDEYLFLKFDKGEDKYGCIINNQTATQYVSKEETNIIYNISSINNDVFTSVVDAYNYNKLYPSDDKTSIEDNPIILRFKINE